MKTIIVPKKVHVIVHDRRYYSAIINERQHVYSFLQVDTAKRCSMFLAEFKHKYNKFPILDENTLNHMYLKPVTQIKRIPVHSILSTELYIKEMDIEELSTRCMSFNIGLIGVDNFDYKMDTHKITLDFGAANLLPDDEKTNYINSTALETLLDM